LVAAIQVAELPLLGRDLAAAHHEHRAEDRCDQNSRARADEDRQALLLDRALPCISRQQVDGTHRLVLDA